MKTQNTYLKSVLFAVLVVCSLVFIQCSTSKPSSKPGAKDISGMIKDTSFLFNVDIVNPLRGRQRHVSSDGYMVKLNRDTLKSYLPFFGRAYQAPTPPSGGGIDFSSHDFTYEVSRKSDHQWEITIVPKDVPDVQKLFFSIFDNGNTTLNVQSTYRQSISYTGNIGRVK